MEFVVRFSEQALYEVAEALYAPVIVVCVLLVLYTPLCLGMALYEAYQRGRKNFPDREAFNERLRRIEEDLSKHPKNLEIEVERLLQAEELNLSRSLDRIRFIIRVGPSFGLMGTLIPMGISLSALAQGNIPEMAGNMVTAFTTTVAGLGAAVLAYLIALTRERWAREDLREMAHAAELALIAPGRDGSLPRHLHEETDDAITAAA
ncbi:MAG: MotA/TolQ/ExbB proton channel family protein [Candidatus Accumulibacter sp.]|jgi:biopolymer transport protein ExbB/TolQ|nr:MotA/TolQ/ExbB proton channel family protein [Accumulibacter sp.]